MRAAAPLLCAAAAAADGGAAWAAWKRAHRPRGYASEAEEALRRGYFDAAVREAAEQAAANPLATFAPGRFGDWSSDEWRAHNRLDLGGRLSAAAAPAAAEVSAAEVAAAAGSADWRDKGAVTQVKDQANCGSCWAFSTTGGIEGQSFLAGSPLVSLSEQELVSCDKSDSACQGGLMDTAFEWLLKHKGGSLVTEAAYPYTSGGGQKAACKSTTGMPTGATITKYADLPGNEVKMASWVAANGPMSVAVYGEPWKSYSGGILTKCAANQPDHGVLIVGFGSDGGNDYWILKNSWGASWGESGFIRLARGKNLCSITFYPCSATAKKVGPVPPGPAPSPPAPTPPTPPTPPSPSGQTVMQKECRNKKCTQGCQTTELPVGKCIVAEDNQNSAKVSCSGGNVIEEIFAGSTTCAGASQKQTIPADQCISDTSGTYVEFICGGPSPGPSPPAPSPPAPPAPTPPTPPTPPSPASGTFTQTVCRNDACSKGCSTNTYPQGRCLSFDDMNITDKPGMSVIATCGADSLKRKVYLFSADCSGDAMDDDMPLDFCIYDEVTDKQARESCPAAPAATAAAPVLLRGRSTPVALVFRAPAARLLRFRW